MAFSDFLTSLFDDGRVTVDPYQPLTENEITAACAVMAEIERLIRLEAPGEPPPFVPQAARWAGIRFYRACQFALFRDLPAEKLAEDLGQGYPEPAAPAVHYSVDIVMRYLPDLLKFSKSASESDPLVEHLLRWAGAWPLSSVGVQGLRDVSIDEFSGDPSLMQIYVDRIIAAADEMRLSDPRVHAAVQSALGLFPEIGGKLARLFDPGRAGEVAS